MPLGRSDVQLFFFSILSRIFSIPADSFNITAIRHYGRECLTFWDFLTHLNLAPCSTHSFMDPNKNRGLKGTRYDTPVSRCALRRDKPTKFVQHEGRSDEASFSCQVERANPPVTSRWRGFVCCSRDWWLWLPYGVGLKCLNTRFLFDKRKVAPAHPKLSKLCAHLSLP